MKLEKAQKIVESVANEERNFRYGEWERAEAICAVLVEMQKRLAVVAYSAAKLLQDA